MHKLRTHHTALVFLTEGAMKQERTKELLQQYGVGPIQFSGTNDALYERHLTFDHVVDVKKASVRDQFEAAAHAVRDIFLNAGC